MSDNKYRVVLGSTWHGDDEELFRALVVSDDFSGSHPGEFIECDGETYRIGEELHPGFDDETFWRILWKVNKADHGAQ